MSPRICLALAAALVAASPALAAAQPAGATGPPHPRIGLFGGFALHAGEIACQGDRCDGISEAGGVSGHLGWGLRPELALIFDGWAMGHTEDNLTLTHTIFTANARYWVVPILWIQGGLGFASASWRYRNQFVQISNRTENVPALGVAAGLEVLRSPRFSLDVMLRVGYGFYDDDHDGDGRSDQTGRSSSLGVGFTWF
jgi:hypothetical protein